MDKKERAILEENVLADLGWPLVSHAFILDLGCGDGELVMEHRNRGYNAYGCDMKYKEGRHVDYLDRKGYIRLIDNDSYKIPFDDKTFDVVVSNQVFEHVKDYSSTLKEIHRVLKPGGRCLHIFPSRYTPIELHVFVPLASVIQSYWWLYLWAIIGVRTKHQRGLSAREVTKMNYEYLRDCTNYLTKYELVNMAEEEFCDIRFCEELFLKHSRRGKMIFRLSKLMPVLTSLYGTFRNRVMAFRKH